MNVTRLAGEHDELMITQNSAAAWVQSRPPANPEVSPPRPPRPTLPPPFQRCWALRCPSLCRARRTARCSAWPPTGPWRTSCACARRTCCRWGAVGWQWCFEDLSAGRRLQLGLVVVLFVDTCCCVTIAQARFYLLPHAAAAGGHSPVAVARGAGPAGARC